MMASREAQATTATCRCGVKVDRCQRGCTLFACCGGYVREGHMSDCSRPESTRIYGQYSRPSYAGPWWQQ